MQQYYVKNSHEAIIEPAMFDLVQHELKTRQRTGRYVRSNHCFAGRILCGECHSYYAHRVLHANTKYEQHVWQCKSRRTKGLSCSSKNISVDLLEQSFLETINSLIDNKAEVIEVLKAFQANIDLQLKPIEHKRSLLQDEIAVLLEMLYACVQENASEALSQEEYRVKYSAHAQRYKECNEKCDALSAEQASLSIKKLKIEAFIAELEARHCMVTHFSEDLWYATADGMVLMPDGKALVRFKCGKEVEVHVGEQKRLAV